MIVSYHKKKDISEIYQTKKPDIRVCAYAFVVTLIAVMYCRIAYQYNTYTSFFVVVVVCKPARASWSIWVFRLVVVYVNTHGDTLTHTHTHSHTRYTNQPDQACVCTVKAGQKERTSPSPWSSNLPPQNLCALWSELVDVSNHKIFLIKAKEWTEKKKLVWKKDTSLDTSFTHTPQQPYPSYVKFNLISEEAHT